MERKSYERVITDPTDRKYRTNKLKNRYIAPSSPATIQAADLLKAKTTSIALDETKGGKVEGWIGKVIQEGGESCNDFI